MPIQPTESLDTARWKIKGGVLVDRTYEMPNQPSITVSTETKGKDLPAHKMVKDISSRTSEMPEILISVKLFSNLPPLLYAQLVDILNTTDRQIFPHIFEDKCPTVGECIAWNMSDKDKQIFSIHNWQRLGWRTKEEYETWLDTATLFAFSGIGHYCSAPRIYDRDPIQSTSESDYFRYAGNDNPLKITNIFSVAGFECRGISDQRYIDKAITGGTVRRHAATFMEQILYAAQSTETTDIVFIPVGMGVFLTHHRDRMKIEILQGWIEALNRYNGPSVQIHCCLMPGQFDTIARQLTNPSITLQNRTGEDAYSVANAIQDIPGRKSMLINAADHDWLVPLDKNKYPSQLSQNHTLFYTTSDEYFGLVTLFSLFSIENLIKYTKDALTRNVFSSYDTLPLEPLKTIAEAPVADNRRIAEQKPHWAPSTQQALLELAKELTKRIIPVQKRTRLPWQNNRYIQDKVKILTEIQTLLSSSDSDDHTKALRIAQYIQENWTSLQQSTSNLPFKRFFTFERVTTREILKRHCTVNPEIKTLITPSCSNNRTQLK